MRRVSKPWPPKNVARDDRDPRSLRQAEDEHLDTLRILREPTARSQHARTNFDNLDKRKLREVLQREQGALCIYCERPVGSDGWTATIDHWRPLRAYPEYALRWENLYLSCTNPYTCDKAKQDRPLCWANGDPNLPWPTDFEYENIVAFSRSGHICVRENANLDDATRKAVELVLSDCLDGSRTRSSLLNLNHHSLVAGRRAALDSEREQLARDFKGRTASRQDREERARQILGKLPLPAFVSIRIAWLRDRLRKAE